MFASHTPRLVIRGSGFSLDGTELTLTPTPRSSYEIDSLEQTEIVLRLKDGKKWADVNEGQSVHLYVTKVDTGAGEVIFDENDSNGIIVAKVPTTHLFLSVSPTSLSLPPI